MTWHDFHHPDISWPVVRRHAKIEFMEFLELSSFFLSKGGWAAMNRSCYPSNQAYRSAKSRLLNQGLVTSRSVDGKSPHLWLTEKGKKIIPPYFHPERYWNRKWNKIWYMLIYDVPESDRAYRDVLRRFLKQKHLGCLQLSVWITPEDIRPEFDDLVQAANIDAFAFLFESKTVLGLPNHRIVNSAWDINRLQELQERFHAVTLKNLKRLQSATYPPQDLCNLLKISLNAYHAAMGEDPLLPDCLLPNGYAGKKAYSAHCTLLTEIDKQVKALQLNERPSI
jgi:phenylacetic acid degradation operon negative regulatory protein